MTSISDKVNEIIETFKIFSNWSDKYEYLIELGKSLPKIDEKEKTDKNIVKGCQSKVWLTAKLKNGKIYYYADSDAIITKGIISLLLKVFSGQKPDDILLQNLDFINKIGLQEHLSPTRANGLLAMAKQIKFYALAFKTKNYKK